MWYNLFKRFKKTSQSASKPTKEVDMTITQKCNQTNCDSKHHSKGYCGKHYLNYRRNNGVVKPTQKDRRNFIVEDGICKVPCSINGRVEYAIVDIGFKYLEKFNWHLDSSTGYVKTSLNRKHLYLHRLVVGEIPKAMHTDHINRDKLDNREANLRVVTPTYNFMNTIKRTGTLNRYRGVEKRGNSWRVSVSKNNISYRVGSFNSEIKAALAYNKKCLELYGEYAYQNKILSGDYRR